MLLRRLTILFRLATLATPLILLGIALKDAAEGDWLSAVLVVITAMALAMMAWCAYQWLDLRISCALCGRLFASWRQRPVDGHEPTLPPVLPDDHAAALCPRCTRTGVGCSAWNTIGINPHPDCTRLEH